FCFHPSPWKLRNTLAAVVPKRPSQAARDGQWQRYLATYVTRKVLDALSIDIQTTRKRCAFVCATSYGHLIDDAGNDTMSTWAKVFFQGVGGDLDPMVVGSGFSSESDAIGAAAAMFVGETIETEFIVAVDIVTAAKRIAHSALGTMA